MGATLHAFLRAAAWGNLANLMNSSLPWSRTVVSVLETPAVRHLVRLQKQIAFYQIVLCNLNCFRFN